MNTSSRATSNGQQNTKQSNSVAVKLFHPETAQNILKVSSGQRSTKN